MTSTLATEPHPIIIPATCAPGVPSRSLNDMTTTELLLMHPTINFMKGKSDATAPTPAKPLHFWYRNALIRQEQVHRCAATTERK